MIAYDNIPQEIIEAARKVTQFFAEQNMHNWVIDGCVSRSADDHATLDHIPAVKALREENAKAWAAVRSSNQLSIDERKLQARIKELEAQLAELRQGVEAVGEVQHLHELNDDWLQHLPVGTKLYTRPQPAIPPGYAAVPVEPTEAMKIDGARSTMAILEDEDAALCYRAMLAAAPSVPVAENTTGDLT